MHIPDYRQFCALARQGNVVPVYRQLLSDTLTPVLAFDKVARNHDYAFLLESVIGGEKIARFSFLGCNPFQVFKARGNRIQIHRGKEKESLTSDNPLLDLQKEIARYSAAHVEGLPRFCGGAVGYASYDVVRYFEHLPDVPPDTLKLPDLCFGFYDSMLIFDHINKTVKVVVNAFVGEGTTRQAYKKATDKIDRITRELLKPAALVSEDISTKGEATRTFKSNFKKKDYCAAVRKCKRYIRAGDIFQVVPSQRLSMRTSARPFNIYRTLRVVNPSPYMFFLKMKDHQLIGSSPEVMVRLENGLVTLRPIAGTRPRGKTHQEDIALEKELLADPKERAEHVMLVDLGRNDVGRVCDYHTVKLDECMVIERYSHVMHIVSNVSGRLSKGKTAVDTLMACLPAGTLSGAPKVRAMEIIDEVEPEKRGPYGGAVGYIDFSGNMDTCITIRTVVIKGKTAYVQAGGGIVADSVPETEYQESLNKAKALLKAIELTEKGYKRI
jgi:anthranilate synthase component 1